MRFNYLCYALLAGLLLSAVSLAEKPKKVLLLAGPPSHGPGAHEHMPGMKVLAKCLADVPGLETAVIDVSEHSEAKLNGIRCHATQLGPQNRFADTPDEVMHDRWFRQECYVLAHSTVGWPQGIETDLFSGLR